MDMMPPRWSRHFAHREVGFLSDETFSIGAAVIGLLVVAAGTAGGAWPVLTVLGGVAFCFVAMWAGSEACDDLLDWLKKRSERDE